MPPRRAFTLVEIAVTLVLMSVLAAAVLLSRPDGHRRVLLADTFDRIACADRLARQIACQRRAPVSMTFDLANGCWRWTCGSTAHGTGRLPPGFRLLEVWIDDRPLRVGQATVPYAPNGFSPTFALRVAATDGQESWLVLTGLTGQAVVLHEEKDVRQIMPS